LIVLVVIGDGAILETVGSFKNLRFSDTPKGKLATVSDEEPCFELHVRLNTVRKIQLAVVHKGEKLLHIVRLLSENGQTLLSAIQRDPVKDMEGWLAFLEDFALLNACIQINYYMKLLGFDLTISMEKCRNSLHHNSIYIFAESNCPEI
jgi:hypothetical protein